MIDKEKVEAGVRLILEGIGEDVNREGLLETPDRIARMYEEIFGGMDMDAAEPLKKRFHASNNEMVVEKDITFYSTCEHHMLPRCLYSKWRSSRHQQAGKNCGNLCKTASDSGAAYGTGGRCTDGAVKAEGGHGHDGSRAYVYDDAWY